MASPFTNPALVTNMRTGGLRSRGVARRGQVGERFDIRMGSETGSFAGLGVERITANLFAAPRLSDAARQPPLRSEAEGPDSLEVLPRPEKRSR